LGNSNGNYEIYKVARGDTLWNISKKFGVGVDQIKKLNGLTSDTIYIGQILKIKEKQKSVSKGKFYRVFVNGKQIAAYSNKENAYTEGLKQYNAGNKDVYLTTPEGYKYTFDKHKDKNPNNLPPSSTPTPQPQPPQSSPTTQPAPQPIDIKKHPIIGNSQALLDQMTSFVTQVNPRFDPTIASSFLTAGEKYGIRGDVAFCQSIHETNWFLYGGDVKPEQNNFAGIGATGGVPGNSFTTIEEGVTAQIQHLFAYASKDPIPQGETIVDPRFNLVSRGIASHWEDLAGRWAYPGYDKSKYASLQEALLAGETYGQRIMVLYERLLNVKVSNPEPKPDQSKDTVPTKEKDQTNKVRSFKSYTIEEFKKFLESLPPLERKINHIQIHHTWRPRKTDYRGESTIYGMWRYHTQTRGWDDIGQHFSISPDGLIWDGRSLEKIPAGIKGYNTGGLMFEIIGNFDLGQETLEGEQLQAVIFAVRELLKKFNLELKDIVFHREHSSKTCPGTGITKEWFLNQIEGYPPDTPEWKKEAVEWMFKEGLLTDYEWKKHLEEPLPLWQEAIILKRLFENRTK
jgi:LysM repeat protein